MAKKIYKLSDESIAIVVKLLQLGLLTGTDIADNFRTLELVVDGDALNPNPEYLTTLDGNIQRLVDEADSLAAEQAPGFKGQA